MPNAENLSDDVKCKICCEEPEVKVCNTCVNRDCNCSNQEQVDLCQVCFQSTLFCLCQSRVAHLDSFKGSKCQSENVDDGSKETSLEFDSLPHDESGIASYSNAYESSSDSDEDCNLTSSSIAHGSSSECQVKINKTTLTYKSEAAKNKYFIPKIDQISDDELYIDKRSPFEVFRDLTLKFVEIVKPSLKKLWESICRYRIDRPQVTPSGFSVTKEQMRNWISEFRDDQLNEEDKKLKYQALNNLKKPSPHVFPPADFVTENEPKVYERNRVNVNACLTDNSECRLLCYASCDKHCRKDCGGRCIFDMVLNQFPPCKCPLTTRGSPKTPYERNKFSNSLDIRDLKFYHSFLERESLTNSERKFLIRLFNKKKPTSSLKKKFVQLLLKYKVLRCHSCDCSDESLTDANKSDVRCKDCFGKNQVEERKEGDENVKINVTSTASNTPYLNIFLKHKNHLSSPINGLVDTGSDASILPVEQLKTLGLDATCLRPSRKSTITTADGNSKKCILGEISIPIFLGKGNNFYRTFVLFLIVNQSFGMPSDQAILGSDFFSKEKCIIDYKEKTVSLDIQTSSLRNMRVTFPYITPGMKMYDCKVQKVMAVTSNSVNALCDTSKLPQDQYYHVSCPGSDQTDLVYINKCRPELMQSVTDVKWPACFYQDNLCNTTGPWPANEIFSRMNAQESCNLTFKSCYGRNCLECKRMMSAGSQQEAPSRSPSNLEAQDMTTPAAGHQASSSLSSSASTNVNVQLINTFKCQTCMENKVQHSSPSNASFNVLNQDVNIFKCQTCRENEVQNEEYINTVPDINSPECQRVISQDECLVHLMHLDSCNHHSCSLEPQNKSSFSCMCPIKSEFYKNNFKKMEEMKSQTVKCNRIIQDEHNTVTQPEANIDTGFLEKDDLCRESDKNETVKLNHIEKDLREQTRKLIEEYSEAFATKKKKTGCFKYFTMNVTIQAPETASQKDRKIKFLPAARKKIDEMIENGLLKEVTHKPHIISNFVQVLKPAAGMHLRNASKADKQQLRNQSEEMLKQGHQQQVRLTCDFTVLNKYSLDRIQVSLPKISDIKERCADSLTSSLDISDGYHSIKLSEESRKYFALYFNDKLLQFTRCPQGYAASPFWFCECMSACFSSEIYEEFKNIKNYSEEDLPYKNYREFTQWYIDDVIITTGRSLGNQVHLRALESVLFAIRRAGLLLSPAKAQIFAKEVIFLGQQINVDKISLVCLMSE